MASARDITTTAGQRLHVAVLGGGLAGIAAAVHLAERGVAVTLVETRQRLGGRATSFVHPATGEVLDNCQHVLLACCTQLIDLYQRLGVAGKIRWHRRLYFADRAGRVDTLEADDLPAPMHLLGSLMRFRGLTGGEKLAIARAMTVIARMSSDGRRLWRDRTFSQWLEAQRQPAGAVRKFWSLVVTSAANETPDRVAADVALKVFGEGFLDREEAYVTGVSSVPLVELYAAAAQEIERQHGTLLLSTSVNAIAYEAGEVRAAVLDGERNLAADAIVSALPFDRLARLCPPQLTSADARLRRLGEFHTVPIVGIHLWLKGHDGGQIMTLPHLALMDSPVHWVFNKGPTARGQHLHLVVSAARDLVALSTEEIVGLAFKELQNVFSAAGQAQLVDAQVIKEKRATFSAAPQAADLRPGARGAVPGLYLAGDWCDTGWPATMEGAVRSGYMAAEAVLEDLSATSVGGKAAAQD